MTRKVGVQIQMATGAIIGISKLTADGFGPYEPLPDNKVISKCTRNGGTPFTRKTFEEHWKMERESGLSMWTDDMVKTLTMIMRAAPKANVNLHALRWSFVEWARGAIVQFKLEVPSPMESALPVRPLRGASKSSTRSRTRRG